ncbi:MAG: cytosolic protein [Nanoarchaeota archaeon]|nr:cytosolic protein [Nanoarchaeota archaeon]MBU1321159.1 cytosolic protein [Nanoarchaeota archaeon]MBU1596959.1 cytosolic protein [Nanoarchaeota archaeon]MBU2441523.1 cytosolic protein [Nanoarchaeota archaeon]
MDCNNKQSNVQHCNCSYEPCDKKGNCCLCLKYHLDMNQLPACCFPDDIEKTYDRSIKKFVEIHKDD